MKYWLDLRSEFITQQQRPAAAERPAGFVTRNALRLPRGIEGGEEIAVDRATVLIASETIGIQAQRFAACRQQQIPSPVRGAMRAGLKQHRIARGRRAMQREQVNRRRQRARQQHDDLLAVIPSWGVIRGFVGTLGSTG